MAQYRLLTAHYIEGDKWLPGDKENESYGDARGTIVGDGTEHKIRWPTLEMVPLDEEAEKMMERERQRLAANQASMTPVEDLALTMDDYEARYVPGFQNAKRGEAQPDGAPRKAVKNA
jgi:hypothetical protein